MLTRSFRLALALAGLLGTAGAAFADSPWEQVHPRRDQVGDRLDNQRARINHDWRQHEVTSHRAHELHEQDARIRERERAMAARDNGQITRHDRERLNHRENVESRDMER